MTECENVLLQNTDPQTAPKLLSRLCECMCANVYWLLMIRWHLARHLLQPVYDCLCSILNAN